MREARIAFGIGLALLLIAIGVVLLRSPISVIRASAPRTDAVMFGSSSLGERVCQPDELLPRGTTAIRVWLEAVIGPAVTVEALSGTRLVTRGARGTGWTAGSVTVPVHPVDQSVTHSTICINMDPASEPIGLQGVKTSRALAAFDRQGPLPTTRSGSTPQYREGPLPGRLMIEYLRPGSDTWLSLITSVARRMGLGHATSGVLTALLAIALMGTVGLLISGLVLKEIA
jgi:hypothetical protein